MLGAKKNRLRRGGVKASTQRKNMLALIKPFQSHDRLSVRDSHHFKQTRRPHAGTDAHGDHAPFATGALHAMN